MNGFKFAIWKKCFDSWRANFLIKFIRWLGETWKNLGASSKSRSNAFPNTSLDGQLNFKYFYGPDLETQSGKITVPFFTLI